VLPQEIKLLCVKTAEILPAGPMLIIKLL